MENNVIFDIPAILDILPHRYPFLLVDKIIEFVDNERIVGIKSVSCNEQFFQGHFPGKPIMPGVLIIEAMAQTGAIMALKSSNGVKDKKYLFLVGVDDVKWRRPVVPGDQMRIEMKFLKNRKPLWIMEGRVFVDQKLVASALITAAEAE